MKIKLLYFAKIKELVGKDSELIELPSDVLTLNQLKNYLISRGAPWHEIFSSQTVVRFALNQNLMNSDFNLEPNAEIAFLPPITGG